MAKGPNVKIPTDLFKGKWLPAVLSLVVGLLVGTSFGRQVLDEAGIPATCVQAIERGGRAIDTGKAVADDGKAAFAAVQDLRIGQASDLLTDARDGAVALVRQAQRFDEARRACDRDRE